MDRSLKEAGLGQLASHDFQHTNHQVILRLIQEALEQEQTEPVQWVLANLPLNLMGLADHLLAETDRFDPKESRVLEDVVRTILEMRRRNISQNIDQLRYLMEDAQAEGDIKAKQYHATMSQYIQTRAQLDRAIKHQIGKTILTG